MCIGVFGTVLLFRPCNAGRRSDVAVESGPNSPAGKRLRLPERAGCIGVRMCGSYVPNLPGTNLPLRSTAASSGADLRRVWLLVHRMLSGPVSKRMPDHSADRAYAWMLTFDASAD